MPITVHIRDEVIPGQLSPAESVLVSQAVTTARELIRSRIQQEVERHNQSLPEVFCGLVQPEESERILNGFRMKVRRPLDWNAQFEKACAGFQRNGFLLIVDGSQISELDEPIELRAQSEVQFVKLVPLVGG
ncbi:MAG: hypothetical protein JOY95_07260 [Silvibacterium sp.]|nr:hypothetical protein [Silvibacterium sp.]MBV8632046.1 hypothetical protein [Silvibacterium sp.]